MPLPGPEARRPPKAPARGPAADAAPAVHDRFGRYVEELRIAAFSTGSANLDQLRKAALRHVDDWSLVEAGKQV